MELYARVRRAVVVDRSAAVVSAFAERRPAAAGVQRFRSRRLGDRSAGVEQIESLTKGVLACALIVRLHHLSDQLVTSGPNSGDGQALEIGVKRQFNRIPKVTGISVVGIPANPLVHA